MWFAYKALDLAELSFLMPFMTLTSLSLIIPPMILLGEFPSSKSVIGISFIVAGVIYMDWKKKAHLSLEEIETRKNNRKGVLYFFATAICYTFTPVLAKIVVVESGNVLFVSYITHLLIAIGFVFLIFLIPISKNRKESLMIIKKNLTGDGSKKFLLATILAGFVITISNGSINYALQYASVSSVFAIKRTMPLFAFLIGVIFFKERNNLFRKIIGTTVMVVGAILVTLS